VKLNTTDENLTQMNINPDTNLCSFDINNIYTKSDAHAQRIMGHGIIPPHDSSICYVGITE
jgi:hypothetical protein